MTSSKRERVGQLAVGALFIFACMTLEIRCDMEQEDIITPRTVAANWSV
jgi:hypothetical protein